jgi:hypothetical protein
MEKILEYVYNYFFDPAKVRGQPYTPLGGRRP